jgi:pyrophosphatase PpaX
MAGAKIKAAVFDFDGMIFDTRELVYQTYNHALTKHGQPPPKNEDVAAWIGRKIHEGYAVLAPDVDTDKLVEAHRDFQDKNLHLIAPYKGLAAMLGKLKAAGIKIGLFTARGPNSVNYALKTFKVADYFESIVTIEDVKQPKPHPEGLLLVLRQLGEKPANAVMLGDSVFDIEAGKRAKVGMTIGLTHGFGTRQDLEKAGADHIVDSLAEIPPLLLAD